MLSLIYLIFVFLFLFLFFRLERDLDNRNFAIEKLMSELTQLQSSTVVGDVNNVNSLKQSQQQSVANDDFAALIGVQTTSTHVNNSLTAGQSTPQQSSIQMTAILQSQRDRYKDKLAQSEASLCKLQEQLDQVTTQKQQLQAENVALFRKVKFLSSYNTNSQSKQGYMYNVMKLFSFFFLRIV